MAWMGKFFYEYDTVATSKSSNNVTLQASFLQAWDIKND